MDKRSFYSASNIPQNTNAFGPKRSKTGRRPWRLCTFLVFIVWICIITVVLNFWIIEEYIAKDHAHVRVPDSSNKSKELPWAHLIFYAASDQQPKNNASKIDPITGIQQSDKQCEVPRFHKETKHPEHVTCKRRKPVEGSCDVYKELFLSKPKPTCGDARPVTICQLKPKQKSDPYQVQCLPGVCQSDIQLGWIKPATGKLSWKKMPNIVTLEASIMDLMKTNSSGGNYGFCFLRCTQIDSKNPNANMSTANQMFVLPQYFSPYTCRNNTCEDAVNVNVIWLDSVSHSHFYRSFPNTVGTLKSAKTAYHVFSYSLMQSMKGGTYKNIVTLTKGIIKRSDIGIGNLFRVFQDGGYHTTYMDDLCLVEMLRDPVIGMPRIFGYPPNRTFEAYWENLPNILAQKGINQVGATMANCYSLLNVTSIFSQQHLTNQCFNGKHYVTYLLEYLDMLQGQLAAANRPYFNYLDLNICHASTNAQRCQYLDIILSNYIASSSKHKNTLTFMFGDHGLKYGLSLVQTKEALIEAAHPVAFIISSKYTKLDQDKLDALRDNQDRLMDIIDIRQTLYTLAPVKDANSLVVESQYDTHPNGLFHPISPTRTCDDLGIELEQEKCICDEGHQDVNKPNGTRVNVLAEFALGELNNRIEEQYGVANNRSGFGLCQRLVGEWIDKVQERKHLNFTEIEMLLHLRAGSNAPQAEDLFHVIIQVTISNLTKTPAIKLIHHLRISSHGVYDECRDDGVARDLCICSPSTSPSDRSSTSRQWHLHPPVVFGTATVVISLNRHLFIYERRTSGSIILEASCDDDDDDDVTSSYNLVVLINSRYNVVSSKVSPLMTVVKSGMKIFLDVFYPLEVSKKWTLEYEVSYRQLA